VTGYAAPLAEMHFVMTELAGLEGLAELPGLEDATPDLVEAVLEEAGKFASNALAPLNRIGDQVGSRLDAGGVVTPPGWREAYQAFTEAGWNGLVFDPAWGGQGLPWLVNAAVQEMWHAANMSFGLCPMLTQGAIEAILFHGSDEQKRLYLPSSSRANGPAPCA
jgi:3-(methylthio)propanoyl-CoA dehydrogenase